MNFNMDDLGKALRSDSAKKRDTQQWIRSKVDYTQEENKKPYSFVNGISFLDCRLPSLKLVPSEISKWFMDSVVDQDMTVDLESVGVLNWCPNTVKLFAINVSRDGSCLLHAVSFAMWGVEDTKNTLRELLLMTISLDHNNFYRKRWCGQRLKDIKLLENTQTMLEQEWDDVIRSISNLGSTGQCAAVPHRFLESIHIYVLANILRRPIIVVAEGQVKSVRGNYLQDDHIGGIYLPLEWTPSECCKTPLIIGYSYNHFCPLISESEKQGLSASQLFPLVNKDLNSLPVQYLIEGEDRKVANLVESYLNIRGLNITSQDMTPSKLLCALMMFKSLKPEFNTMYDHLELCKEKYKKKYGVEPQNTATGQIQEPVEQLNMPGKIATAAHSNPYYGIQANSQTMVAPVSGKYQGFSVKKANYAQAAILTPTAPPLSIPPSLEAEPLSMMNERCQNKACGFRCSLNTYPFCHECFKEEQLKKQQKLLINPLETPFHHTRGLAISNITANNPVDETPKKQETTSTAIKPSYMSEHEPGQASMPQSHATAFVAAGVLRSPEKAFAETEEKNAVNDVVVSEEPSLKTSETPNLVKCASPVCDTFVEADEKLCTNCKNILLNSHINATSKVQENGKRMSQPVSTINESGTSTVIKSQEEREKQLSHEKIMDARKEDFAGNLSTGAQVQKEKKLISVYEAEQQPMNQLSWRSVRQYPSDKEKGLQYQNERQSPSRVWTEDPYEPEKATLVKSQTVRGKYTNNPRKSQQVPLPAREVQQATSEYLFNHSRTGSASVISPYDMEEPKSIMVTSKSSMSSRREPLRGHAHKSYQPSAESAESKLKEVEEWSKRIASKCKTRDCQNFGNKEKNGYCNSCFGKLYGEDVPDCDVGNNNNISVT